MVDNEFVKQSLACMRQWVIHYNVVLIRNLFSYTFWNRSTKRPVRYIEAEVLSEEDGSDTELLARDSDSVTDKVTEPCPTKKAKVSKRAVLVEDNESTSANAKEHKSTKPKTAKNESKEKRNSKKKKKEKKGVLLKEKYVHVY